MAGCFTDRVAVVTGGASGIGAAVVRQVLAEGGSVVAVDIDEAGLEELAGASGERLETLVADVTQEADMERMVRTAVDRFGGLHAGFNVAGASRGRPITEMSEADWDWTVDLCLKGVFLAMKHEARQMLSQGESGAIVVVSSLNSEVPMFGGSSYCSAKAGAAMLAKCGALELGDAGIRVNAISPGLVDTPLTAGINQLAGVYDAFMERIPMGRPAQPEDIASAAAFLAADDSRYISGVNLFVDGAWSTTTYPDMRKAVAAVTEGHHH
jgi:NAD(P)-dependent dehydrogenase (short-subunit alcohol dehydrogenase family)